MKLFEYLDEALLKAETSKPRVSREAFIWPSSASATLYDQTENKFIGKCHRAEVWKMIGEPQTNPTDEVGARRFRMGRACEADVIQLAKDAGIFIAAGVRAFIPDINMTLELDMVVLDPKSNQAVIIENKSIYGYFGNKEVISEGKPKKEAVMQLVVYLNEFRNGALLKEAIKAGLAKKQADGEKIVRLEKAIALEKDKPQPDENQLKTLAAALAKARYDYGRNRIEVDQTNLEKTADGPLAGKLAYESRDECQTRELDVAIWEDPVSKKHFPQIDGEPYQWFDIEDLYARWRELQSRFKRVQQEAIRLLKEQGIEQPDEKTAGFDEVQAYWDQVGMMMRRLPKDFLPPAEYEWSYSKAKIEAMWNAKLVGKTRYEKWKKGAKGFERLGAWQCVFCAYRAKCLPMEYPELAYMALQTAELDENAA